MPDLDQNLDEISRKGLRIAIIATLGYSIRLKMTFADDFSYYKTQIMSFLLNFHIKIPFLPLIKIPMRDFCKKNFPKAQKG